MKRPQKLVTFYLIDFFFKMNKIKNVALLFWYSDKTRTKSVPSWPREMWLCTVTMHKFDSLHNFILCTFIVHDLSSMHRFILCKVFVHSYCAQIELYARDYSVHNLNFMQRFILWTVIVHTLKSMHRLILWILFVHDLNSLNRFKLHTF